MTAERLQEKPAQAPEWQVGNESAIEHAQVLSRSVVKIAGQVTRSPDFTFSSEQSPTSVYQEP